MSELYQVDVPLVDQAVCSSTYSTVTENAFVQVLQQVVMTLAKETVVADSGF